MLAGVQCMGNSTSTVHCSTAALVSFRSGSVQGLPDFQPVCIARGAGECGASRSLQDTSDFYMGSQSNPIGDMGGCQSTNGVV